MYDKLAAARARRDETVRSKEALVAANLGRPVSEGPDRLAVAMHGSAALGNDAKTAAAAGTFSRKTVVLCVALSAFLAVVATSAVFTYYPLTGQQAVAGVVDAAPVTDVVDTALVADVVDLVSNGPTIIAVAGNNIAGNPDISAQSASGAPTSIAVGKTLLAIPTALTTPDQTDARTTLGADTRPVTPGVKTALGPITAPVVLGDTTLNAPAKIAGVQRTTPLPTGFLAPALSLTPPSALDATIDPVALTSLVALSQPDQTTTSSQLPDVDALHIATVVGTGLPITPDKDAQPFFQAAPAPIPELDAHIVLLVPSALAESDVAATLTDLDQSGTPVDDMRRVDLSISKTNVRFYHAEDAQKAQDLAHRFGTSARDFTSFTPAPREGLIEVWLAGKPIKKAKPVVVAKKKRAVAPVKKVVAPQVTAPRQVIIITKKKRGFLGRMMNGGARGTEETRRVVTITPTVAPDVPTTPVDTDPTTPTTGGTGTDVGTDTTGTTDGTDTTGTTGGTDTTGTGGGTDTTGSTDGTDTTGPTTGGTDTTGSTGDTDTTGTTGGTDTTGGTEPTDTGGSTDTGGGTDTSSGGTEPDDDGGSDDSSGSSGGGGNGNSGSGGNGSKSE